MIQEIRLIKLKEILAGYKTKQPFQAYLKDFFGKNKQMGSQDRRFYANAAYAYLRLHKGFEGQNMSIDQKIVACCALTHHFSDENFVAHHTQSFETPQIDYAKIFVAEEQVSELLNKSNFFEGYAYTPKIWLRIRKGYEKQTLEALEKAKISYETDAEMPNVLGILRGNITDLSIFKDGFVQVQDRSSQLTARLMHPKPQQHWWDSCAASGGKSLLLHDLEPTLKLYVTDLRSSVLNNLKTRFKQYNLKNYQQATADLSKFAPLENMASFPKQFDGVILDAPCTGSGTWGRTPEQLLHFEPANIAIFAKKQIEIAKNTIQYLKIGSKLLYITCSVYKAENEDIVASLVATNDLKLDKMQYIEGAKHHADTLFCAVLTRI